MSKRARGVGHKSKGGERRPGVKHRKPAVAKRDKPFHVVKQPTIIPGKLSGNQTIIHKHHGFVCPKCGYPAYKLSKHTHCPLCIICSRCGFSVRNCKCIEGE